MTETFKFPTQSPRDNRNQTEDLQLRGIQHLTESTGARNIGATDPKSAGNTQKAMQPHAMSGQHMRNKELKRTQFTAFQLHKLEETFIHSQYISTGMRQLLSQELGLSDGSIKNWFKNRRVKWRKKQCQCIPHFHRALVPFIQYFGHVPYPNRVSRMTRAGCSMEHNFRSCPNDDR